MYWDCGGFVYGIGLFGFGGLIVGMGVEVVCFS